MNSILPQAGTTNVGNLSSNCSNGVMCFHDRNSLEKQTMKKQKQKKPGKKKKQKKQKNKNKSGN